MLYDYLQRTAARHPERAAIEFDDQPLSYAALDAQARQLALLLRAHDVPAGSHVAFWLPKAIDTYVTLHGALMHGCAYVPIDISAPAERVGWILADSRSRVFVCRGADYPKLAALIPECVTLVIVTGSSPDVRTVARRVVPWTTLQEYDARNHDARELKRDPESLAYLLYTSGSTGTPKGVALSHRAAEAFVDWAGDLCAVTPDDRVANHAALSFDLSIFDIFAAARAGACLCPVPHSPLATGYFFARFIASERITIWYSVPTVLARIAEQQERQAFSLSRLRVVIFAGEPFRKPELQRLRAVLPAARLLNWYGPTETNVCTWYEVSAADLANDDALPIGWPCPYSGLEVAFDGDDVGELYVSGRSLLSGYIRQGALDRSPLVTRPGHGSQPFYATGDFVSRSCSGCFSYHGRRDSQIKRNGYRIELGEIEQATLRVPGVRESAAVFTAGQICLFVVRPPDEPMDLVSNHLAKQLPVFMLPDHIAVVPELPRTERGKIDRTSLKRLAESAHA